MNNLTHKLVGQLQSHKDEISRWAEQAKRIEASIALLQDIASGKHGENALNHDIDYVEDNAQEAIDFLLMAMLSSPFQRFIADDCIVSDEFWDTELGLLIMTVKRWMAGDELITISEAAVILRGSADNRDLVAVNGYIKRGRLDVYTDHAEPNPNKAQRVLRSQVEALRK